MIATKISITHPIGLFGLYRISFIPGTSRAASIAKMIDPKMIAINAVRINALNLCPTLMIPVKYNIPITNVTTNVKITAIKATPGYAKSHNNEINPSMNPSDIAYINENTGHSLTENVAIRPDIKATMIDANKLNENVWQINIPNNSINGVFLIITQTKNSVFYEKIIIYN